MKKKDVMKIKRYFFFSLLVLFTSCSDWLDVTPKDIVDEEDLLKSHLGYRNALNGVYKQMGEIGMYGKELTWGFVDVLANPYYLGSSYIGQYHAYNKVANYKYADTDVKSYIESIWTLTYNSIANCNNIIGTIEDADSMMFPMGNAEKNLIMGEAYGLRALLHFDMLRLFAPAPVMDNNKLYIPYFDRFPSYGENNLTVTEVLNRVVADLIKARDLVASYDTLSDENVLRLTVNGGNYKAANSQTTYPLVFSRKATVYLKGGKYTATNASAVYNENGKITISGGNYSGNSGTHWGMITNCKTMSIKGGTFTNSGYLYALFCAEKSSTVVSGGKFTLQADVIRAAYGRKKLLVNGGTFKARAVLLCEFDDFNIKMDKNKMKLIGSTRISDGIF